MANSSYVQRVKKSAPYSIEMIGSREDYAKWKVEQEFQKDRFLALAKAYEAKVKYKAIEAFMKPAEAVTSREHYLEALYQPQPPKSLMSRFKTFCANIWRDAFDSER